MLWMETGHWQILTHCRFTFFYFDNFYDILEPWISISTYGNIYARSIHHFAWILILIQTRYDWRVVIDVWSCRVHIYIYKTVSQKYVINGKYVCGPIGTKFGTDVKDLNGRVTGYNRGKLLDIWAWGEMRFLSGVKIGSILAHIWLLCKH